MFFTGMMPFLTPKQRQNINLGQISTENALGRSRTHSCHTKSEMFPTMWKFWIPQTRGIGCFAAENVTVGPAVPIKEWHVDDIIPSPLQPIYLAQSRPHYSLYILPWLPRYYRNPSTAATVSFFRLPIPHVTLWCSCSIKQEGWLPPTKRASAAKIN